MAILIYAYREIVFSSSASVSIRFGRRREAGPGINRGPPLHIRANYQLITDNLLVVDGGSAECDPAKPAAERHSVRINSYKFITPETASSSFYHYFQLRNFGADDPAMTDLMNQQFGRAFSEDKVILEQIQSIVETSADLPNLDLAIAGASLRARRKLAGMIGEQRAASERRAASHG